MAFMDQSQRRWTRFKNLQENFNIGTSLEVVIVQLYNYVEIFHIDTHHLTFRTQTAMPTFLETKEIHTGRFSHSL